jgi:predicted secreted acid phosphatase
VQVVRISRRGHGHSYGNRKPAIVFDVDETALSNYSAIDADNFTFGTNSRAETTNEVGKAIPATLELYNLAKAKHITLFFVTGRGETPDNRSHTEHNLQREGYTGWQHLYLKPAGFTGTTTDYKSGTRKTIEDQGYRIVANVGDQYSDLAGGHEAAAFKLPNPFYFLP